MYIFISYRHRSAHVEAATVRRILESSGISVWQDCDAIDEGRSITGAVAEGLERAVGAVVIFSKDFLLSGGCFLELAHIVCRLHRANTSWLTLVWHPDGDHSHVRPGYLCDIRDGLFTSQTGLEGALDRLVQAIRSRNADSQEATVSPALPKPELYGAVSVTSALTVPCGHEEAFWCLHDLLHVESSAQTCIGLRRRAVRLASVPGGGAAELVFSYAALMRSCFPGGVFWLTDDGGPDDWLSSLRVIGEQHGLEVHELHRDRIEAQLARRLRSIGRYLWVVLRHEGSDRALTVAAPTENGMALCVCESPDHLSMAEVVVGPIDRGACGRLLQARLRGQTADAPGEELIELVYEKSAGHLEAVLGAAELIRAAGAKLAQSELTRLRSAQLGLRGYIAAYDSLTIGAREILAALAHLPADATVTIPVIESLVERLQRLQPNGPTAIVGYAELISMGAIAKTPDRSAVFVVRAWRASVKARSSKSHSEQSAIDITSAATAVSDGAVLRPHLVRALLDVMPADTRARHDARLPQLASLARSLLSEFHSEDDCELAVRCAAIHSLYGDQEQELEILESAFEWSRVELGRDHTRTIELLAEKTQCPRYPRAKAEQELSDAFDRLVREGGDSKRTPLRLRIALRFAIEIGDGNPGMALQFLHHAYGPFAESSEISPLQHVQIRTSQGVFERALKNSDCLRTWRGALGILNASGLSERPELMRLQSNIASVVSDFDPAEAASLAHQIFERQLELYGMRHPLTLWAAVDLLQYCLMDGRWKTALMILRWQLGPYREKTLGGPNESEGGPSLSPDALWQLARVPEIARVAVQSLGSGSKTALAAASKSADQVLRTQALLELLEFGNRKYDFDSARLEILGNFLRRRKFLAGVDWSELQGRLEDYYVHFNEYRWHTRATRRVMRRLAKELVADLPWWKRWRPKLVLARRGLPVTHL